MASEVTSDLNSEISDLNNPCSSACLAPKCFFEPFDRRKEGRKEGQNRLVDLRADAADKKARDERVSRPLGPVRNLPRPIRASGITSPMSERASEEGDRKAREAAKDAIQ